MKNKNLLVLGMFLFVSALFFVGCEKEKMEISTNEPFDLLAYHNQMIEQVKNGTYSPPQWTPPTEGITLSDERYLIFETQEALDGFINNIHHATIDEINEWEQSIGYMSLRRSGLWKEKYNTPRYQIYNYPFDDLLMSTIVNTEGYVKKLGVLNKITNEGIHVLNDGIWHLEHPVNWEKTESSISKIENRQGCLDDDNYDPCNKFWPHSVYGPHRLTGILNGDTNWIGFAAKIRGRTTHALKQDCNGGYNYCVEPADELELFISAHTTSGQRRHLSLFATDEGNLEGYIYVSYFTCFDNAYSTHEVTDMGTYRKCTNNISI